MLTERDLKSRVGPILSDGTLVRDLIDLERREVSMRVLNDPEIHELELRRIFARTWVIVGHVAEIPNPGDYVLRYIGEDQVIVARDDQGQVNILLNTCSHRGMEVCRAERGNEPSFQCPYHGWVFDTQGRLQGAPYEKIMYGDWDKSAEGYGLLRARVGIQSGIIFGNFDQNGESLDDYLGEYKYYLDFTLGENHDDMTVMSGVLGGVRTRLNMNWKIMNDQFCGDHYHSAGIHKNSLDNIWKNRDNLPEPYSAALGTDKGHVLWRLAQTAEDAAALRGGFMVRDLFPSSGVLGGDVGGRDAGMVNLAMFVPKGPRDCELANVTVMSKVHPLIMDAGQQTGGGLPGGPINDIFADDNTQGPSVQRAVRGVVARNFVTMKYPGHNGPGDEPEGLMGPAPKWGEHIGYAYVGTQKDENQWNWWRHYFDVLTAED
jgi:nitrite reductase/ring-hydroxylating ferredoxin subunit